MLTPAERFVLGTCSNRKDMLAVIRAARREIAEPGSVRTSRLGFGVVFRYVFLVGLLRQPVLYIFGPIVAVACYLTLIVKQFI